MPIKFVLPGTEGVLIDKGDPSVLPNPDGYVVGDVVVVLGVPYVLRSSGWAELSSGYQRKLIAGDNIQIASGNEISASFDSSELATKDDVSALEYSVHGLETTAIAHTTAIAENATDLTSHITGDELRWQQIGDANQALYAKLISDIQAMIAGTTMPYDTTKGIIIFGASGLLDLGGGQVWSATQNGVIIVVYSALLGVAPVLTINDETISYGGISLLGSGAPSDPIPVSTGDRVSASGVLGLGSSFNVTFYPTKI